MIKNLVVADVLVIFGLIGNLLFAAQPLVSIVAVYKAPTQLASNSFTAAIYQVMNKG